jgi:hypothetical protein
MTFMVGFFKQNHKVVPYTPRNSLEDDASILDGTNPDTVYIYLLGNTEDVVKSKSSSHSTHPISIFQMYAHDVLKQHKDIPNTKVFLDEKSAFKAAKDEFPAHAISIMKVVLPLSKLNLRVVKDKRTDRNVEVTNPDLFRYVESIKAVNTRHDLSTLVEAKIFTRTPYDEENPLAVNFSSAQEALFVRRNKP